MELRSKLLEQKAFSTGPKVKEHMLIVMDESTHEEHLSHPLPSNKKQFKIAITFLTCYNGIFNVTNSNINFFSRNRLLRRISYKLESQKEFTKQNH